MTKIKIQAFFDSKTVFHARDFEAFYAAERSTNTNARRSLLTYYIRTGRLKQVRRGLYLSVSAGVPAEANPYLISGKLAADSVIAYYTAMQFHGKTPAASDDYMCCSHSRITPFEYEGCSYTATSFPRPLINKGLEMSGVQEVQVSGETLRVTTLERTMVDMLRRPELCGGWEEVWRALRMVDEYDADKVLEYVELLDTSATASRVGFFLDKDIEGLSSHNAFTERLMEMTPIMPHFLDPTHIGQSKFVRKWNLMVPDYVLTLRTEK